MILLYYKLIVPFIKLKNKHKYLKHFWWSHCIKYAVQRHKVGTIVIGCTYFSFRLNALFQRIFRLIFIFQRIPKQSKNIKTVSIQHSARTVPQKKLL